MAPDHHACILQLHLTSSRIFIRRILSACMSVTVSSYQHPCTCILHLHPTISHVCNNCTRPFPMSLTVASNQQSYHSVNLCIQACMSDTPYIFVIAISYHLCCLMHLQQTILKAMPSKSMTANTVLTSALGPRQ